MSFNSPDPQKRYPKQFPSLAYARAIEDGNKKYEEELKQIEETRRLREEGEKKKADDSSAVEVESKPEPIIRKIPAEEKSKPQFTTNSEREKMILDSWTNDPKVQSDLQTGQNIYDKLAILNTLDSVNIDNKRTKESSFGGDVVKFDNSTKSWTEGRVERFISGQNKDNPNWKERTFFDSYADSLEVTEETIKTEEERDDKTIANYEENKKISNAQELIFSQFLHLIFGNNFEFSTSSKYIDRFQLTGLLLISRNRKNEVDFVISIDFTTAPEDEFLVKKIVNTNKRTTTGNLLDIDYVESKYKGFSERFSASHVPHLIIPMSKESLDEIAIAFFEKSVNNNAYIQLIAKWKKILIDSFKKQLNLQSKLLEHTNDNLDLAKKQVINSYQPIIYNEKDKDKKNQLEAERDFKIGLIPENFRRSRKVIEQLLNMVNSISTDKENTATKDVVMRNLDNLIDRYLKNVKLMHKEINSQKSKRKQNKKKSYLQLAAKE